MLHNLINCFNVMMLTADFTKLDNAGEELLNMGQKIGYWVVVVVAVFQIIKASASGDRHKIGEILLMSVIVYGALFIVPYSLELVANVF